MQRRKLTKQDMAIVQAAAKELSKKYGVGPIKASLDDFKTGTPMGFFDNAGKLVAWRVLNPATGDIISGIGEVEDMNAMFSTLDDEDDLDHIADDIGISDEDDLDSIDDDMGMVADPELASLVRDDIDYKTQETYEDSYDDGYTDEYSDNHDPDRFDRAWNNQIEHNGNTGFVEKHSPSNKPKEREKHNPAVMAIVIITTLLIIAGVCFGAYKGVTALMDRFLPSSQIANDEPNYDEYVQIEPAAITHVEVTSGTSATDIRLKLCEAGVPNVAREFLGVVTETGAGESIQASDYIIRGDEDAASVVARMVEGDRVPDGVIGINEGDTVDTIIANVAASGVRFDVEAFNAEMHSPYFFAGEFPMLVGIPDGLPSLEGYFRTGEYNLYWCESPHDAVRCLLNPMQERFNQSGLNQIDWFNVLNKAAMIEKEAMFDEDRPLIASVIENRLTNDMQLQIDATIQYATGSQESRVMYSDLEVESPYNTYANFGLPLGPICSGISEESINAVLAPAQTDFLYYVLSDMEGHHVFTADPGEFEVMKQNYLDMFGYTE